MKQKAQPNVFQAYTKITKAAHQWAAERINTSGLVAELLWQTGPVAARLTKGQTISWTGLLLSIHATIYTVCAWKHPINFAMQFIVRACFQGSSWEVCLYTFPFCIFFLFSPLLLYLFCLSLNYLCFLIILVPLIFLFECVPPWLSCLFLIVTCSVCNFINLLSSEYDARQAYDRQVSSVVNCL